MASAANVNLSAATLKVTGFVVGNTFELEIDFVPPGSFDFTGATGKCRIVKKSDNTTVQDLTTGGGGVTFPTSDSIRLFSADTATALWPICDLLADVEVTFQDTTVRTLIDLEIRPVKPITPA
jgi:hypothetical protein